MPTIWRWLWLPMAAGPGLAALPLFDALVLALANQPLGSLLCVLVFFLLPHLQRWIKPT